MLVLPPLIHVGCCENLVTTVLAWQTFLPMLLHTFLYLRLIALDRLVWANVEVGVLDRPTTESILAAIVVVVVFHMVTSETCNRIVALVEFFVRLCILAAFVGALYFELL